MSSNDGAHETKTFFKSWFLGKQVSSGGAETLDKIGTYSHGSQDRRVRHPLPIFDKECVGGYVNCDGNLVVVYTIDWVVN